MWLKWSGWSFPHQGISDHNSLGFQQLKKKSLSFKKWVDQSGSWAITYLLQHETTSLGYISRPYTGNSYSFCVKYLVREGRVFFIVKLTHSGCMPQWACRCATLHRTKGAWIPRLSSYKNETRSSPGHNVPALNISESTYWEGDRDWWVAIKTISWYLCGLESGRLPEGILSNQKRDFLLIAELSLTLVFLTEKTLRRLKKDGCDRCLTIFKINYFFAIL